MSKILIVGGGVAGLSAGIYARLAGHEAIVCERHFLAGGNLTGWNRGEYHIDNCIHWLTGSNPSSSMYKMWEELGALGQTRVIQGNSLFTCERDGKSVSLYCSLEKMKDEMLSVSPEDKKEINDLAAAIEFIMGVENTAGKDANEGITLARAAKGVGPLLRYYGLTTGQMAKRFKHPALQCFITGFWGDDFGALALIYVFATYCGKNGALPEGGSLKMAERMTERFKSLGGTLRLKCDAVKVNLNGRKAESVTFADGTTEKADYVILTTDPGVTFGKLLDFPMPKNLKKMYDNPKLKRFSAYHCAFACDAEKLPFDGDLIFDMPEEFVDEMHTKQLIVREFAHEPSYAPKGKNILQTMTFCFEEDSKEFIRLRNTDKQAYNAKKERIATVLRQLIEEHCPTLRGKLTLIDVWTPASYNRFVNSEMGSFMSFSMPEKYLPICLAPDIQGLENVFLATQWQQSPGGLPIAARCGKSAVEKILKLEAKEKKGALKSTTIKAT